jgi:pimeloyl-ACP methyl ester carboxylesterase
VALYLRLAGTPAEQVARLRLAPQWPGMAAVAPTLAYDHAAIMGEPWSVPAGLAARVSVPALVLAGDASLPFLPDAARVLAQAMPRGQLRTLAGQAHAVNPACSPRSWRSSSPHEAAPVVTSGMPPATLSSGPGRSTGPG